MSSRDLSISFLTPSLMLFSKSKNTVIGASTFFRNEGGVKNMFVALSEFSSLTFLSVFDYSVFSYIGCVPSLFFKVECILFFK